MANLWHIRVYLSWQSYCRRLTKARGRGQSYCGKANGQDKARHLEERHDKMGAVMGMAWQSPRPSQALGAGNKQRQSVVGKASELQANKFATED